LNSKEKIALVTGCKRGIGKVMVIALAEAGADIIGASASLEKQDNDVEKDILELGRKFSAYQCDFSNRKALLSFIKKIKTDFPIIDILVNNADTIKRAPAADHDDDL